MKTPINNTAALTSKKSIEELQKDLNNPLPKGCAYGFFCSKLSDCYGYVIYKEYGTDTELAVNVISEFSNFTNEYYDDAVFVGIVKLDSIVRKVKGKYSSNYTE